MHYSGVGMTDHAGSQLHQDVDDEDEIGHRSALRHIRTVREMGATGGDSVRAATLSPSRDLTGTPEKEQEQ